MKDVTFKKDGLIIGEEFITLGEINRKCKIEQIKDEKLLLLKMQWDGWRGFDEGILEVIALPAEKIDAIKKVILGRTINFGEIAGKHSEIYNTLDENDIEIIEDPESILAFMVATPGGHSYNHSFLNTFYEYAADGGYEDITEEQAHEFYRLF
jgi:hypothetical protein